MHTNLSIEQERLKRRSNSLFWTSFEWSSLFKEIWLQWRVYTTWHRDRKKGFHWIVWRCSYCTTTENTTESHWVLCTRSWYLFRSRSLAVWVRVAVNDRRSFQRSSIVLNYNNWFTWREVRGAPAEALVYWRRVEASVLASSASEVDSVTATAASSWNTFSKINRFFFFLKKKKKKNIYVLLRNSTLRKQVLFS